MADAEMEKTTAEIVALKGNERFTATGEVIKFDGFLRVYTEGRDDDNQADAAGGSILPALTSGEPLQAAEMVATERFTQQPPRYTEASLVKKMEELGIGRPSTYAPTISTIQNREYITRGEKEGTPRSFKVITMNGEGNISVDSHTEITGSGKGNLIAYGIVPCLIHL